MSADQLDAVIALYHHVLPSMTLRFLRTFLTKPDVRTLVLLLPEDVDSIANDDDDSIEAVSDDDEEDGAEDDEADGEDGDEDEADGKDALAPAASDALTPEEAAARCEQRRLERRRLAGALSYEQGEHFGQHLVQVSLLGCRLRYQKLGVGSRLVGTLLKGEATAGDIAFAITAFMLMSGYLRNLGENVRMLQKGLDDAEDVASFAREAPQVADRPGASAFRGGQGEIVLDAVTFRYRNAEAPLYEDFSLRIAPGEKVALVGPTGAGKSTFVKLIPRLHDLQSGRILIDGEAGADFVPGLAPLPGELEIVKPGKGAFYNTRLTDVLVSRGITHLIFGGVTTEVCVQTTMREANDRGYECLLVEEATGSYFPEFRDATIEMIRAQGGIVGWTASLADLTRA